jgi:insertion element IS1 protein InsB
MECTTAVVAVVVLFAVVNMAVFLVLGRLTPGTHISDDHRLLLTSAGVGSVFGQQYHGIAWRALHGYHYHNCGRQFVDCFEQYLIADDTCALIERLLVERISLRGICRAVGVGLKWLLGFLVDCVEALPDHLHVQPVTCHGKVMIRRLEVEADEMSSFVQNKANKQWIWIAMDATSRQVIAFHVGDRSRRSAKRLWAKIPMAYRQHATFYTDQYVVYKGVIPAAQHRAISKLARKTNHVERFNNTLRQRVSRLVREALSFSKKLANHIGAIKMFICHYNLTRAAA